MLGKRIINTATGAAPSACTTDTVQILDGVPLESIATYQLDGAATSIPNNTYPGTFTNPSYATGKFGQAAVFNGTSSFIAVPAGLRKNNNFTASIWFNTNSTTDGQSLISFRNGKKFEVVLNNSNVGNGSIRVNAGNNTAVDSATGIFTTNTWYNLVVVQSSVSGVTVYLNNSVVASNSGATGDLVTVTGLDSIGAYNDNGSFFNGSIDQFRYFNKALNSTEVETLYNETVATASNSYINLPSLVAYYKMSDATDETGSYDGTPTNVNFNVAGKFGNAGEFNGSSSGINLPSSTPISNQINGTVSLWFNVLNNTKKETLIRFANNDEVLLRINTNGTLDLIGVRQSNNSYISYTTTGSYNDGAWHHLVMTRESGSIKFYINNSLDNTLSWNNTFVTAANESAIGWDGFSTASILSGKIDQVRIFNRAITANEVTTLYDEVQCIPTIVPSEHFNTVIYTGTGSTQPITEVGFQPDFVWTKSRENAYDNNVVDSVRGLGDNVLRALSTNLTEAENTTTSNNILSLDLDGFTIANAGSRTNSPNEDYVSWNLKAGGAAVLNEEGTINSQVSANVEAGFSIVGWTGTGSAGAIGHGLSSAPELIIMKNRDGTNGWVVRSSALGNGYVLLNSTSEYSPTAFWGTPTDSVFSITSNSSGVILNNKHIAYCFHSVEGFSKIGSYTGTGNTVNVVTGFEPKFIMIKCTSAIQGWSISDSVRSPNNPVDIYLTPHTNYAEESGNAWYNLTYNSNGFTVNGSDNFSNGNGQTYIFMAFAADPTTIEPTLEDSFNTVTYAGDGGTQPITSLDFQPDLVWIKERTSTSGHHLGDSVRGATKMIYSNLTNAESTDTATITSFDTNGFTVGSSGGVNAGTDNYVAWCWKAAELPAINSNGSITSVVSANPAAGFSIVKYNGNETSGATIGHGLSSAPELIIVKELDNTNNWQVYSSPTGATKFLYLNSTIEALTATNRWNDTSPSATVFTIGNSLGVNRNSSDFIAYCFHSVDGYQKVGSYTGVTGVKTVSSLGFKPRFIIVKYTGTGGRWIMVDSIRGDGGFNVMKGLQAQDAAAEFTNAVYGLTFTNDGFVIPSGASGNLNVNGNNYIYLAIA